MLQRAGDVYSVSLVHLQLQAAGAVDAAYHFFIVSHSSRVTCYLGEVVSVDVHLDVPVALLLRMLHLWPKLMMDICL